MRTGAAELSAHDDLRALLPAWGRYLRAGDGAAPTIALSLDAGCDLVEYLEDSDFPAIPSEIT